MSSNKVACVHITRNGIRLAAAPKASRFFHGDRLAFMADMVGAIIDAMMVNSFAAKTLHIVYDNGVDVQKKETGTIVHKKSWGKYITESGQGELYTTVTMERDPVNPHIMLVGDAFADPTSTLSAAGL